MASRRSAITHGRLLGAAAVLFALSACGSGGADGEGSADGGGAGLETVNDGELTYCSDISAPPLTYFDENQTAVGTEVELGDAIAAKLDLEPVWKNIAFAGIIPALETGQCDAIISQLYIKPEREEIVDFVPYMYAGNTVLVPEGNPGDIGGVDDLCGLKVATQTGTTAAEVLTAESAKCEEAGEDSIDIAQFGKDSEAMQQLKLDLVDAYGTTVEVAGYAISNQTGSFETAGEPFNKVETGIATTKENSELHEALEGAFAEVREEGTYDEILEKWELTADALPES